MRIEQAYRPSEASMRDPAGDDDVEDKLLEEFAIALHGEIGARAAVVADTQAEQADRPGVAQRWRQIAGKVRALG